jgi:hypothetical protein
MAAGVSARVVQGVPGDGPWLFYGDTRDASAQTQRCVTVAYCEASWRYLEHAAEVSAAWEHNGMTLVLPKALSGFTNETHIDFDLPAHAFFFLSSWVERASRSSGGTRALYAQSAFARLRIPQNVVDRYLEHLLARLSLVRERLGIPSGKGPKWPDSKNFAVVLSHDVDFLPSGIADVVKQGAKTFLRHTVLQRRPIAAVRSMAGLATALVQGRDPYGCVPEIIEQEQRLGVRSSFQVAVARRHPNDVNYSVENLRTMAYLRTIVDSGFDLCLHGSYRSTENRSWYVEEARRLTRLLARPLGSRQHFLSFDYDTLFKAQEEAGIQYDMSLGFPDRIGSRSGFSFPFFPYCLERDRPYDVLEISLFLMDVTLQSYMALAPELAWRQIEATLDEVNGRGGCISVVWHPIVFGGARDPGYDALYWRMVDYVKSNGGLATDGRTINEFWRARARHYGSFAEVTPAVGYQT